MEQIPSTASAIQDETTLNDDESQVTTCELEENQENTDLIVTAPTCSIFQGHALGVGLNA